MAHSSESIQSEHLIEVPNEAFRVVSSIKPHYSQQSWLSLLNQVQEDSCGGAEPCWDQWVEQSDQLDRGF